MKIPGVIAQPPLLSNMKYHPGHTFGKSDLNSRRGTVYMTDRGENKQMFASTLSKAISQDSFKNFKNTFNKGSSPPKENKKLAMNKHSSSVSDLKTDLNFKKNIANLNETAENIRNRRKGSNIPTFTEIRKK